MLLYQQIQILTGVLFKYSVLQNVLFVFLVKNVKFQSYLDSTGPAYSSYILPYFIY